MSSRPLVRTSRPCRAGRGPWPLLLGLLWLLAGARATDGVDEYELKAAFLGKFVKYVSWPSERLAEKQSPLVVTVFGRDPFGKKLDQALKGVKVEEHPIEVRRVEKLEELRAAHVLFVPQLEAGRLEEILAATREASLLVVGESSGFAENGGAIGFYLEKEKLRFEVNLEAAKRQNLKVSSDLLKVARIVKDRK